MEEDSLTDEVPTKNMNLVLAFSIAAVSCIMKNEAMNKKKFITKNNSYWTEKSLQATKMFMYL